MGNARVPEIWSADLRAFKRCCALPKIYDPENIHLHEYNYIIYPTKVSTFFCLRPIFLAAVDNVDSACSALLPKVPKQLAVLQINIPSDLVA